MPTPANKRDYAEENRKYKSSPAQIKAREERNKARALLMKEGKVHKGDGKEVDHIKPLADGGSNKRSNMRVLTAAENDGRPKGKQNRKKFK